jgi:multidrug efflux pump subunit AcrA (membrane-fusion protein)
MGAALALPKEEDRLMSPRFRLRILFMTGARWHKQAARSVAMMAICSAAPTPISVACAQTRSAPHPAPVEAALLTQSPKAASDGNIEQSATVLVPATIQAFFVTDLYAKNSGYVSQINSDIGDHVIKGQALAVIANPELRAQSDKAQAAVQQATAAVEVAKRQITGLQADLALQDVTLRRQKELFAGKAATAQMLDEAQAKQGASAANLGIGKAKLAAAEADLQAAKAEAERIQALLQYDRIVAPFDSVVTRRLVNPGDLAQAAVSTRTTPLFTTQQIDTVRVLADVPESSAVGIRPGLAADVTLYGPAGTTVHGSVTRIATALDPATRTMRVEIDLPNPDETLRPGMYAQVTLRLEPQPTAGGPAETATPR